MNVIFNGKVHQGTRLSTKDGHLFLDEKDLGECDDPRFRASTVKGEVYFAQWGVIDGGANGSI